MEHRANAAATLRSSQRDKGALRNLRRLFAYLRPYRGQVVLALIAITFTASSVLALGAALRYLIDHGISQGNMALLDRGFAILLGVTLLLALASYARYTLVAGIGEKVVADLRRDLYDKLLTLHVGFFETTRTGELLSRLTTDTTLLQSVVGSTVSVALRNVFLLVGGTALLLITSFTLTSYVFLILPVVVLPIILLGRRVRLLSRDTQEEVATLHSHAEETIHGVRTVHALTMERAEQARFDSQIGQVLRTALSRIRVRGLLTAIVIALVFGAVVTVLWIGGREVIAGNITPGALSSFVFYAVLVASATGAISEIIGDLQRAAGAAERIMELLAEPAMIVSPEPPAPLPSPLSGRLALERLSFTYPARPDRPALHDIDLTLQPGERVALVGPSGSGKSTLLALLLRFYDPEAGRILLDGADIRSLDLRQLRGVIGYVPQDPLIFSDNAWNNIRCARPTASDGEVLEAAQAAAALDFLQTLPNGLDTYLGEKGVRLSGGQRQRIAIARAILRDPQILLLDEATSALDSENEQLVQQALERLMAGRTSLIIAHRLATIRSADRIVVLDEGRIEAIGSHDELMAQSGIYARLAALQFKLG